MVLKEKRFRPPKMHAIQGDPRRTWPSLERLIAEQEAHYQNGSAQEVPEEEPRVEDDNQDRAAYRADSLVVPIDPKVGKYDFPEVDPPKAPQPVKVPTERSPKASAQYRPPRDWNTRYEEHQRRRRKQPLEDATTYEMARLYAWAYYRLQRLAVQIEKEIATKQAKIDRLQAQLNGGQKKETNAQPTEKSMNNNEEKNTKTQRQDRPLRVNQTHAQADLDVAPGMGELSGGWTGTTPRRHAHADEGMAPSKTQVASTAQASPTIKRGPP